MSDTQNAVEQTAKDDVKQQKTGLGTRLGYGPIAAVLVGLGSFFVAQVAAVVVMMLVLGLAGWDSDRIDAWFRSSNFATFAASLGVSVFMLVLLTVFLRRRKTHIRAIGLVRHKLEDIFYGMGGLLVYFVLTVLVVGVVKYFVPGLDLEQQQELGYSKDVVGPALVVAFLGLVILPPLAEEILFRGFLYTGLRSKLPVFVAAIITSILFGVAHLQWGSENPLHWAAALDTLVLSFVLIYLRQTRRSLWPAIYLHMFKNGYAFLALFVFKVV
jgi:membrane protease YdiL (CAAX protease family)